MVYVEVVNALNLIKHKMLRVFTCQPSVKMTCVVKSEKQHGS